MSNNVSNRTMLGLVGLNLYPPSIRENVLSDNLFVKDFNFTTDAVIIFENDSIGFQRSTLLKVIRKVFAESKAEHFVIDENGSEWNISRETINDTPCLKLAKGEHSYLLDFFWPLIPDIDVRMKKLDKTFVEHQLPFSRRKYWEDIFSKEALSDDDLEIFTADLEETLFHVSENLKNEMIAGSSSFHSLVPQNIRYYERLVGQHIKSNSIIEYSFLEADTHFNEAFLNGSFFGLTSSLLLASQVSISESIEKREFDESELERLYDWLITHGDPFSRTGGIEIGLSLLDKYSFLEEKIETLVKQAIEEKVDGIYSLLSSVIMMVDGELSRLQIFKDKPPFFRRLASIGQASLITRCAVEVGVDIDRLTKWAKVQREMPFYCQTMIDLRFEPRWQPDYLSAEQLKDELLGRIYNAAEKNNLKIHSDGLIKILLSEGEESLKTIIKFQSFLPGPLEGNIAPNEMPPEISKIVEDSLSAGSLNPGTFTALANCVQYWKPDPRFTELALKMLCDAKHQLSQTQNNDEILFTLNGLSRVAAITKNTNLAEELCILSRVYRNYLNVNSQPEQLMVIGFVSAAAYDDLEEWTKYIGQWITELAYLPLTNDGAIRLKNWLKQFFLLEPALRCSCGRALAVLESINN